MEDFIIVSPNLIEIFVECIFIVIWALLGIGSGGRACSHHGAGWCFTDCLVLYLVQKPSVLRFDRLTATE